jgi:hypothetical protein
MDGLNYVQAYLDDILILTKNTYEIHLHKVDTVLQKQHAAINLEKSMLDTMLFEYLGFHIKMSGICPLTSKVEVIQLLSCLSP